MHRSTCFVLVALCAQAILDAEGVELFRDSFEKPGAKTWRHIWGPCELSTERAREGKHSLKEILENRYGYSTHFRDLAARPRTLYTFSAWAYIPSSQPKRPVARLSINTTRWRVLASAQMAETDKWVKLTARYFNVAQKTLRFELMQARQQAGLGGAVMFWDSALCTAKSGAEYMKELRGRNPHVVRGLDISPAGGLGLRVDPGECVVQDRRVVLKAPTTLKLGALSIRTVRNEKHKLTAEKPRGWATGTRLRGCITRGTTLPGCLVPGSVAVKVAPEAEPLEKGRDYLVDEVWGMLGRVEGGRIGADTAVCVDYSYSLSRLDTVEVSLDGGVSVRKGVEAKTCPHPPGAQEGSLALANVFLSHNTRALTAFDIFPIGPPLPAPSPADLRKMASRVAKARAKLAAGGRLRIGFWGDSVTCGGDASGPEHRFADGFAIALRRRYPRAAVEFFNAGVGGSNSRGRLPDFGRDVIEKRPDLVVIEFVNDMGFAPSVMRDHYSKAIGQVRAIGGEVILITPHFTMPAMMGFSTVWEEDRRPACQALRDIADDKGVGVADAARVWQHLAKTGIPYTTLLYNGINHPDDRGHRIFIDELLKLF